MITKKAPCSNATHHNEVRYDETKTEEKAFAISKLNSLIDNEYGGKITVEIINCLIALI